MKKIINEKNYVNSLIDFNNKLSLINKGKPNNKEELKERIKEYFNLCLDKSIMPTVERIKSSY